MFETRMIHESDPANGEAWSAKLEAVHDSVAARFRFEGPMWHTALSGDWRITLDTSSEGDLCAATISRFGEEQLTFMRDDTGWEACGRPRKFEEAHFHNLVTMATRKGLEWSSSSLLK